MIEVTDGMLALLREYQMGAYGELDDDCDKRMIAALIELHEANKPKPEPVGYIYHSSYEKALRNESSCKMFVVPVTNLDTGEESSIPLYTTPPTRKPLSKSDLGIFIGELMMTGEPLKYLSNFARTIEKAHGIGVK